MSLAHVRREAEASQAAVPCLVWGMRHSKECMDGGELCMCCAYRGTEDRC